MTPTEAPGFTLLGIAERTNNANEMSGSGVIGAMWQRVISERIPEKIPNRADKNIIAMYTDYASDAQGDYTFLVGAKVSVASAAIPEGMSEKQVPAMRYAVFTSEKGPVWEVVPKVWQRIWSTPASELGGERAYIADFELYDERATDPKNAVVEVWVGIR
jgi:predicted transcriptional regulator YdeE